jgi:pimeloyl-ACP methyl ester carboxylesterase
MLMRWGSIVAVALLALPAAAQTGSPVLKVGTLTLEHCNDDYDGYCGTIERPLDPTGTIPGTVAVSFEWYSHTGGGAPAEGTIVAVEGGPGYSSTDSRGFFLDGFASLRDSRDILVFDRRGTGKSGAIDCPLIQNATDFDADAIAQCARQLGSTAGLYGTPLAVDDLAAVLEALEVGPVDIYGDSYGTYFTQIFVVRHPDLARSAIIDGAYPVVRQDAWFATEYQTGRRGIDLSCDRSATCRAVNAARGDTAGARLEALVEALRSNPVTGTSADADGNVVTVTADPSSIYAVVNGAGGIPATYRELDAAARAWLDHQDAAPLLRLVAEQLSYDSPGGLDAGYFSAGLFLAAVCVDYPQPFDVSADAATRREQIKAALKGMALGQPDIYTPFTVAEAASSPVNWEKLDLCADWPAPPPFVEAGVPVPSGTPFPDVPVLVISGDLDSITSPEEGLQAALSFPNAKQVVLRNTRHVALYSASAAVPPEGGQVIYCVDEFIARFIRDLDPGDVSCPGGLREIRTVPAFARTLADVVPAVAAEGNTGTDADLRLAAVAAEAAGDVITRYYINFSGAGVGLRGGTFSYDDADGKIRLTLEDVLWTEDVAVSGTVIWDGGTGEVAAALEVTTTGRERGQIALRWTNGEVGAEVAILGTIGDRTIRATRAAP